MFACGLLACSACFALPVPDHVVIVIEENHNADSIIGSPEAPYINALAASGASFSNFYALTHPSQPNYLHLYSGSNQGVIDDVAPPMGAPFTSPNLGAELLSVGKTFAIYSEDLPAPGSTAAFNDTGSYSRRHNPVVNWQSDTPGPNQYGPAYNLPFTSFPSDFGQLPHVSFVIPNNINNMHSGTVARGDSWLRDNIKSYADWAQTHNSLLIVTWDEDEFSFTNRNRIATIFNGPMVRQSQPSATWTLHNMLRTIEDMYGTTHAGSAAAVRPIVGAFVGDPEVITTTRRGFGVTEDTDVSSSSPDKFRGDSNIVAVTGTYQGLLRFNSVFGNGPGQTPVGANILSAKLIVTAVDNGGEIRLHRMLRDWNESSTWNSLDNGVSFDDVEAQAIPEFRVTANDLTVPAIFDVTTTLSGWAADPASNRGWVFSGSDRYLWRFRSSEGTDTADRPTLEITYERPHWGVDAGGQWSSAFSWISGIPTGAGAKANFLRNITAPRTIDIGGSVTIGAMTFDSDVPYTLAGGAITLASLPGVPTAIDAQAGTHHIAADVHLEDDTPITIANAARLDISGTLTIAGGRTMTKFGFGTLNAGGGVTGSAGSKLVVQQGIVEAKSINGIALRLSQGQVRITPDGTIAGTSRLMSLDFAGSIGAWQGQLDLTDNSLVVEAADIGQITDQIRAGLSTGSGIVSSAGFFNRRLGAILNDSGAGPRYTTFDGAAGLDGGEVLIKYTLIGDLNLDGQVSISDFIDLAAHFNSAGTWGDGDINYDGVVTIADFIDLASNFNSSLSGVSHPIGREDASLLSNFAAANVPEPALVFPLLFFSLLGGRRSRGRPVLPKCR